MGKSFEVEVRGLLTKQQFIKLGKFLKEKGTFKTVKNRVLIDYSTFLEGEGIRGRNRDIRLRVTNGIPEIIVKIGNWGGNETRKEISVLTKDNNFDKLVQIFGVLGLKKGVLCVRNSHVYDYNGIEFALVEVPGHSFYFEAEILTAEKDKESAKIRIQNELKKLKLKEFSNEEFYKYIEKLNEEANEIFDFTNYEEDYFKKRFKL